MTTLFAAPEREVILDGSRDHSLGEDKLRLERAFRRARAHYLAPLSRQPAQVSERFRQLAEKWIADTGHLSSASDILLHPAYQQIIGLGWVAVPLLLRELQRRPDQWGWALEAITGENPIPDDHAGKIELMRRDWIEWGKRRHLIA